MDSRRGSSGSNAPSTRHILDNHNPLLPPSAPFAHSPYGGGGGGGNSASSSQTSFGLQPPPSAGSLTIPGLSANSTSDLSLSVNYIPSKFGGRIITNDVGPRRRKGKNGIAGYTYDGLVPKRGGGVDAFRSGEARIGGRGDDDYDGVDVSDPRGGVLRGIGIGRRMKWTRFKWILFVVNFVFTAYSLTALIFCLMTWFNVWTHADIVRVANNPELIFSTLASSLGLATSLLGWAGILLNNRAYLAVYCLLTWVTFAFLVVPGYITYRRLTFNLEGKLNLEWSRTLGYEGRSRIQNELGCCGYFSPFVEASVSSTCYARSVLPGCKRDFLDFERLVLGRWFKVAFGLVPFQIAVMIAGLLCSNHVTHRFGKGMMPPRYRLGQKDMAVIMEGYAQQLAEQYGQDIAADIMNKSRKTTPNVVGFGGIGSGDVGMAGGLATYNSQSNLLPKQ